MNRVSNFALSRVDTNFALQDILTRQTPSLPFLPLNVDEARACLSQEQDSFTGGYKQCRSTTCDAIPRLGYIHGAPSHQDPQPPVLSMGTLAI